jgi:6-phosphogluconolactonase
MSLLRCHVLLGILFLALPEVLWGGSPRKGTSLGEYTVYVGTYNLRGGKGIYGYRFDPASGRFASHIPEAESTNPSFLVISPDRRFLYAVGETDSYQGRPTGSLRAYRIDPRSGGLTLLNEVSSLGAGPCYISMDQTGRFVLAANYDGGSFVIYPVLGDGRLAEHASAFVEDHGSGVDRDRQAGPHLHAIQVSPDNRYLLATDLGLDKLFVYRFDSSQGSIEAGKPPYSTVAPGAGPRHFVFDPHRQLVYEINEMGSTVMVFSYDRQSAALSPLQTVTSLPEGFAGQSTAAEIAIDPGGRFLYASNRGSDSIRVFAMHGPQGKLTPVASGRLSPTGQVLKVPSPACVVIRTDD